MTKLQRKTVNKGSSFLVDYKTFHFWAFNLMLAQTPCSHADGMHFTSSQDVLQTVNHRSTAKLSDPTHTSCVPDFFPDTYKQHVGGCGSSCWKRLCGQCFLKYNLMGRVAEPADRAQSRDLGDEGARQTQPEKDNR